MAQNMTQIDNKLQTEVLNTSEKIIRYKAILPNLRTEQLRGKHAALLVSLTSKLSMPSEVNDATLDLLLNSEVQEITIVLGGYLRRHDFWASTLYRSDSTTLPEQKLIDEECLQIETSWINTFKPKLDQLKQKFNNKFHLLRWQDFLKTPNYQEAFDQQQKFYSNSKEYQDSFESEATDYLSVIRLNGNHKIAARKSVINFLLEEMPLLSKSVLPCDFLLYPSKMNTAVTAAYTFYNKNDPTHSRWVQIKNKTEIVPTTPVGYSSKVIKKSPKKPKLHSLGDAATHNHQKAIPNPKANNNKGNNKVKPIFWNDNMSEKKKISEESPVKVFFPQKGTSTNAMCIDYNLQQQISNLVQQMAENATCIDYNSQQQISSLVQQMAEIKQKLDIFVQLTQEPGIFFSYTQPTIPDAPPPTAITNKNDSNDSKESVGCK